MERLPQTPSGGNFEVPDIEGRGVGVEVSPIERTTYEARDGAPIEVTHNEFNRVLGDRSSTKESPQNEIVFLPGVGLDVGTKTARNIGESFARCRGGGRTQMIRSKVTKKTEDPFAEETEAIKKFIEEKGLENFILVGNSQGGDRAITIAVELGDKVRALVLIDSVGLYDQDPWGLARQFFKNSTIDTPKDLVANLISKKGNDRALSIQRGLQSGADIMFGIINDIRNARKDNSEYIERIKQDVETMAKANPRLVDVRVPVVLISGRNDSISDPRRIAPIAERNHNLEVHTPLGRELAGKDASHRARVENATKRERHVQNELFPNSPWVRMVVPEKITSGHGVQLFRPEAIATTALGLIERGEREAKRGESGARDRKNKELLSDEKKMSQSTKATAPEQPLERFWTLNQVEKKKTEIELEKWMLEERRARRAGRIFEQAYCENQRKEKEGELKKYKQGIFNFEFGTMIKGVAALREPSVRGAVLEFLKKVTFDYFGVQYERKEAEPVDIEKEVDRKVPFQKEALFTYLSFVPYWIGAIGFMRKEFGEESVKDVSKLLTDMVGFYAESGMIFRKAQTTMKRGGDQGLAYKILHAVDKPLNLFPSLHGEVAAHTYSRVLDSIDEHADNPSDYLLVKDRVLNRASGILDSCLLTKQHSAIDLGGSMAMISARDSRFTEERAKNLINNMFRELPAGMTAEVAGEVREEILSVYLDLIQKIHSESGKDYTEVLIEYISNINQESVHG